MCVTRWGFFINDLTADFAGDASRRRFPGIPVSPTLWPALIDAAGFESMPPRGRQADGPHRGDIRTGARASSPGKQQALARSRGRADVALHDAKAASMLVPECPR
jgi:hypothetical protein